MGFPIPTSGEAMVSLKGRVGRGSNYRRRRFTAPKRNTFWYADEPDTIVKTPQFLSSAGPQLMWSWTPGTSTNEVYSEKLKLIGMQGRIPVWVTQRREDTASPVPVAANGTRGPVRLWYWWVKQDLDTMGNELAPAATGMDPSPAGQLQNILRRTDVLRWGCVDVPIHYRQPAYFMETSLATSSSVWGTYQGYNHIPAGGRSYGYVPLPPIDKRRGMNLDRGNILALYGAAEQFNENGASWNAFDEQGYQSGYYEYFLRLHLAR